MDYYVLAEKKLREGRKTKAFEVYKETEEYKIKLYNKADELKNTFESKRNQRILLLVESDHVPDLKTVADEIVSEIHNELRTCSLLIDEDDESFSHVDLNAMQHFDALDVLSNKNLIYSLYMHSSSGYFAKALIELIRDKSKQTWIKCFQNINKFKKHDSNFMNRNCNMESVELALTQRYNTYKNELLNIVLDSLSNENIVNSIFENEKYAYLQESLIYRDTLRQMIMDKIPTNYAMFYPMARTMHRHFILHIGPTNSGKTYDAIADLMLAQSGVYLAPLRLLALENQEKMNHNDVPCSLYTGEEQILVENAKHLSSTIETLSLNAKYDIAVIDEAQLINDDQRGWAWTRAILGVQANVVHVCMSSDAEQIVKRLIKLCDDSYEVIRHHRSTPLTVETQLFDFPKDVREHDALIVFSRKSVWDVVSELARKQIKASIIYGALPPTVRREEVRKFVDGETSVVVATDAIGMGLNLPIKRIVFLETEKFDGKIRRPLEHYEYKQIAGRAGRLGIFDVGYVATVNARQSLKKNIEQNYSNIEVANILFPESLLTLDSPLIDILKLWTTMVDVDMFKKADIEKEIALCELLDEHKINLSKRNLLSRIQIPFNHEDSDLLSLWLNLVETDCNNTLNLQSMPLPKARFDDNVQDLELKYKECDLLFSFARVIGSGFDVLERIMDAKRGISDMIIVKLKENKKNTGKKCKSCHKPLPFKYKYGYCQKCYNAMQLNKYQDWY